MQWNAKKDVIPEFYIKAEHLRVLEDAIANADEFSVWSKDVEAALNYFTARVPRHSGVNLFWQGIRQNRQDFLTQGLAKIKRENGL
jgi:hypothetical protein